MMSLSFQFSILLRASSPIGKIIKKTVFSKSNQVNLKIGSLKISVDSLVKINQSNQTPSDLRVSSPEEAIDNEAPELSFDDDDSFISVEDLIPQDPNNLDLN